MSLKYNILSKLEENRGVYLSGQTLAQALSVSRSAVWKAMKSLTAEGNEIDAVSNLGYRLKEKSNALSIQGIRAKLPEDLREVPIEIMRTVDSTNSELKRRSSLKADYILLAEEQSGGRGRSGKHFFSPPFTSIYVSFLLEPKRLSISVPMVTTAAAVAVSVAVKEATGAETQIKWVNDLLYLGKKVVGILTESTLSMESGEVESLILGIGLNCNWKDVEIPDEIRDIAGSLETDVPRNTIAATMISAVYRMLYDGKTDVLEYARTHSYLLQKAVEYVADGVRKQGIAEEIDGEGHLIVRLEDGGTDVLRAGEVSVRRKCE